MDFYSVQRLKITPVFSSMLWRINLGALSLPLTLAKVYPAARLSASTCINWGNSQFIPLRLDDGFHIKKKIGTLFWNMLQTAVVFQRAAIHSLIVLVLPSCRIKPFSTNSVLRRTGSSTEELWQKLRKVSMIWTRVGGRWRTLTQQHNSTPPPGGNFPAAPPPPQQAH